MGSQMCRLCYNETENITQREDYLEIYSLTGLLNTLDKKIENFLNLDVRRDDEYSKDVCPACWHELIAFDNFYERVHAIQKRYLGVAKYNSISLKSIHVRQISSVNHVTAFKLENSDVPPTIASRQPEPVVMSMSPMNVESNETVKIMEADEPIKEVLIENNDLAEDNDENKVKPQLSRSRQASPAPNESQSITAIDAVIDARNASGTDSDDGYSIPVQKLYPPRGSRIPNYSITEPEGNLEFPPRDPSNEDLPAPEVLSLFPKKIIEDGRVAIGRKELMLITSKFYKLECGMCKEDKRPRFLYIKSLFDHYRDVHGKRGYVSCCNSKYFRYDQITIHMIRHVQPEPFRCDICGYMVTWPRFLQSHISKHLPESERPLECPYPECGRRFSHSNTVREHIVSHQPSHERRQYVCYVCGQIFDRASARNTHMWQIHSDRKKPTRINRKQNNSNLKSNQTECFVCQKVYKSKAYLYAHVKAVHGSETFNCILCNFQTNRKSSLEIHLRVTHSDKRPYQCDVCKVPFKSKYAQRDHMLRHTDPEQANELRKTRLQMRRESRKRNRANRTYLNIEVLDEAALDAELVELSEA